MAAPPPLSITFVEPVHNEDYPANSDHSLSVTVRIRGTTSIPTITADSTEYVLTPGPITTTPIPPALNMHYQHELDFANSEDTPDYPFDVDLKVEVTSPTGVLHTATITFHARANKGVTTPAVAAAQVKYETESQAK